MYKLIEADLTEPHTWTDREVSTHTTKAEAGTAARVYLDGWCATEQGDRIIFAQDGKELLAVVQDELGRDTMDLHMRIQEA